jgi:hypothetical protein
LPFSRHHTLFLYNLLRGRKFILAKDLMNNGRWCMR